MTLSVTSELVESFAELTGDRNPIHLDDERAATARFGRRIAHGALLAGVISAVIGTKLPGPGAIYVSQSLRFRRPVYIGDEIEASVAVAEKLPQKRLVRLRTWCTNQDGDEVAAGDSTLLVE